MAASGIGHTQSNGIKKITAACGVGRLCAGVMKAA
jgi:hypothetical protein